jgi:hypothetical protein
LDTVIIVILVGLTGLVGISIGGLIMLALTRRVSVSAG